MKKVLFIACVMFSALQSVSQDYHDMANYGITPASHEVQLSKTVNDIPVNLSTGIPSINIPIGSIPGKSIQMPIQIGYSAIGIKVEQKASFVGLGWSLFAGGQISRTVRGWHDECSEMALTDANANDHHTLFGLPNGGYLNNNVPETYADNNADHRNRALRTITGRLDLQPDEFYFNFLNYSGMFVFDGDGQAQLVPEQNLEVTYDEVGFTWFQIEDENGFRYKFTETVTTATINDCNDEWNPNNTPCSESNVHSTWHLTEVTNAYGEIEFIIAYHDEISITSSDSYQTVETYGGDNCPPLESQNCTLTHYQEIKHVEKIIGNGYYAEFHLGAVREDVSPDKVLDRIQFFLEDGTFLGENVFHYSYFGSGESNTSVRLRLDSVQEINSSLQTLPPTKFIYNSQLLPQYGSKAIDHWGFYNGRTSISTLIPQPADCFTSRDPYQTNRIKSASLETIIYPTGASTQFYFEPNTYSETNDSIINGGGCPDYLQETIALTVNTNLAESEVVKSEYFRISQNQNIEIDYFLFAGDCGALSSYAIIDLSNGAVVNSLEATQGQYYSDNVSINLPPGNYELRCTAIGDNTHPCAHTTVFLNHIPANIFLKNRFGGGLRLKAIRYSDGDTNIDNDRIVYYDYEFHNEPDRSSGYLLTQPRYTHSTNTGYIVYRDPSWFLPNCLPNINDYVYHHECSTIKYYSFSTDELLTTQGGYVFYRNVTERTWLGSESGFNGSTEYNFLFEPNQTSHHLIHQPVINPSWRRGHPVSIVKKNALGQVQLKVENQYDVIYSNSSNARGLKAAIEVINRYTASGSNTELCLLQFEPGAIVYTYPSEYFGLIESKSTVYSQDDPNNFITTITTPEYNTAIPHLPSSTVTETSDPLKPFTVQRVKYVGDYTVSSNGDDMTSALNYLINTGEFGLSTPVETITLIGTSLNDLKVVSGTITTLKIVEGQVVTDATYELELATPINEASYTFSSISNNQFIKHSSYRKIAHVAEYDAEKRPIATQEANDILTTVLRDYSDGRVVAEVVNASPNECAYTSFETTNGNGWIYNQSDCHEEYINHLGFSLPRSYTGKQHYKFNGSSIQSSTMPTGEYTLTFWTFGFNGSTVSVTTSNGATVTTNHSNINDGPPFWKYHEYTINASSPFEVTMTASNGTRLDELRMHPTDARMSTTTYNIDGTTASTCGPNNRTWRFLYDSWKRLEWTLDDNWQILTHHEYHIKDQHNPNDQSWTKDQVVMAEGMTREDVLAANANDESVVTTVTYSDGLGRTLQSLAVRQNPNKNRDLVTSHKYDALGRETKQYLPFVSKHWNDGEYITDPETEVMDFYDGTTLRVAETAYPFAETEFEASPLSRPIRQGHVGEEWQLDTDHTIKTLTLLNDANEVLLWSGNEQSASAMDGELPQYYPANTLIKKEVEDEHGQKAWEYTNNLGQVVCKRVRVLMSGSGVSSFSWTTSNGSIIDEALDFPPSLEPTWRNLDAYFIYDDFGRLLYELPAIFIVACNGAYQFEVDQLGTNNEPFDGYVTAYHYDQRGRLVSKKTPGEGWSEYVYNNLGQVVLSKSPALSTNNDKWNFVKYDILGRPVQTGFYSTTATRIAIQQVRDAETTNLWETKTGNTSNPYNGASFPSTNIEVLTETYYDDYAFDINSYTYDYMGSPATAQAKRTRGATTGTKIKVLENSGTEEEFLTSVNYYDADGRLAVQFTENILGGFDKVLTEYDYTGKVTKNIRHFLKEVGSSDQLTIVKSFEYDHGGRPTNTKQKIGNDDEVTLSKLIYNQLGQVVKKHLHIAGEANSGMQIVDYRYNERGWLTKINNADLVDDGDNQEAYDVFGEELIYHNEDRYYSTLLGMNRQFNGNIAAIKWKTNSAPDAADASTMAGHSYVFRYDKLGQMVGAFYAMSNDTYIDNYSYKTNSWDEKVSYDANGNICTMIRKRPIDEHGVTYSTPQFMDQLNYTYIANSNKVLAIQDTGQDSWTSNTSSNPYTHFIDNNSGGTEYTYDTEGRMVTDLNKGLTFEYNHLDLVKSASEGLESVIFTWDATGQKLKKQVGNTVTYYFNGIEYSDNTLTHVATSEGIARSIDGGFNSGDWVYDYYLMDHLGNVRAVVTTENSELIEERVTMEIANRWDEDENFENVGSTEKDKPYLYPYDPADPYSQKVSELSAYTGKIMGPAKLMSVRAGETIDLSTKYWYTEAPGDPLTSLGEIIAGTLLNLGTAGTGIIPSGPETGMALINNVSGSQFGAFNSFLTNAFQNVDLSKPQAYLVYMYFDKEMNLDATNSGILQVGDANSLSQLSRSGITPTKNGYFYTYVTNTSQNTVSFDNLTIKRWAPMVRVVYDYYPFGLSWENPKLPNDPEGVHDHAYQDKEFQFAEFSTGHGLALYDFHARMYDPATGRWLVPDPAEQFANPYIAMANNPVSYVDPDGEFAFVIVGAVVGAYIGGAMANDHLNPGKWDFQDPNTWIGIGVGGTIGAFGGHGLMAAKGKAAFAGMSKGSAAAKAGGKKLFGSTVGGTTNAISNYDGADSFGWGTLADFGAGFAGSYVGLSTKSWAAGFNAGGFANAVSNIAQDGFGSAYEFAQDWVGGGLSSTLGMKYGKLTSTFTPFGTETTLAKAGNAFVKNGLAANAWDFAYSDWEKYKKKSWGDHLALFAVAGATASITDAVMKPTKGVNFESMNGWQKVGEYTGRGMWGMAGSMMGYNLVGLVKSRQFYYSSGSQQNKAEQMSLKWWLNLIKP